MENATVDLALAGKTVLNRFVALWLREKNENLVQIASASATKDGEE